MDERRGDDRYLAEAIGASQPSLGTHGGVRGTRVDGGERLMSLKAVPHLAVK